MSREKFEVNETPEVRTLLGQRRPGQPKGSLAVGESGSFFQSDFECAEVDRDAGFTLGNGDLLL